MFYTRMVNVTYVTDSMAGTYMGIVRVLQLQNPYAYSIKSVLDQLGFPPSLYTPHVDGSFEFHLNYPAMNFLALIPTYLAGLHDVRDGVLLFHFASLMLIFALVPPRLKGLSLAPFSLGFPFLIGYSWTDSVWAFFILMTAVTWRRNKGLSLVSFGLAVATKQVALVAGPFLLIRFWKEKPTPRARSVLVALSQAFVGFLAPNLPFIISSPSSWWTAAVGPYLPSSTPLIPGGIGLSEILPDFGLTVSPTLLGMLTILATLDCILIFARYYRRLDRFLWAMPIVVLFFYPRSFPNYIIYWGFPYIYEWFRYGTPSINLGHIWNRAPHLTRPFRPNPIGVVKRRVGPALMLLAILSIALIGASSVAAALSSMTRMDVKLIEMRDPDGLGVTTRLDVSLVNHRLTTMHPRFFVKWFFLWDYWTSNDTDGLASLANRGYELNATDALAGIPRGTAFRVGVYDSLSGEFLTQSQSYVSIAPRPHVANPSFAWWTLDMSSGRPVPFAWKVSLSNTSTVEGGIAPSRNAFTGVKLWLNLTSSKSQRQEVELAQRVLFNETNLAVQLPVGSASGPSSCAFGLEVSDGSHSLDYVLSPISFGGTVTRVESNTTLTGPIKESALQSSVVDMRSLWLGLGWTPPTTVYLSVFLRSTQDGSCTGEIRQLSSV